MKDPIVSIITPAYNAAVHLPEAIESVRSQSFKEWEMIISDDGSTDDTFQIADEYSRRDPRIRVISNPNSGRPGIARNRALKHSRGKTITFLDADDLWETDKLELQLKDLDSKNLSWGFSNSTLFGESLARSSNLFFKKDWRPSPHYFNQLITGNGIPCLTIIVNRSLLEKVCENNDISHAFDESNEIMVAEDWHLWLRLAQLEDPGYIAKPLAHYRMHEEGISRNQERLILCNINVIRYFQKKSANEIVINKALRYQHTKLAITKMLNTSKPWRKLLLQNSISLPISARDLFMAALTLLPRKIARITYRQILKYF